MRKYEIALGALVMSALWAIANLVYSNSVGPLTAIALSTGLLAACALAANFVLWARRRRMRRLVAQVSMAPIEAAIDKFEMRSEQLKCEAWIFLAGVLVLLFAGAFAVIYAKNLTVGDIGTLNLEEKIAAEQSEKQKITTRIKAINDGPTKTCNAALRLALQPWMSPPPRRDLSIAEADSSYDSISRSRQSRVPTGDKIIEEVVRFFDDDQRELSSAKRTIDSIGMGLRGCGQDYVNVRIYLQREQLEDFRSSLAGKQFVSPEDAASILSLVDLSTKSDNLDKLDSQYNMEKVEADLGKPKQSDSKQSESAKVVTPKSDDLFLTLLQTSITRFGLLAVIGFFVSILVSLYRYNIRLAGFYIARADALRLLAPDVVTTDFVVISASLTPAVEFGKAPPPPAAQLVDLMKSTKEVAK